jgi:imidazolonepropionase
VGVTATAVVGIGELTTHDGPALPDAAVVVQDGRIAWVGQGRPAADDEIDLGGRAVIPGFVDSHTHLVFAGDRVGEFVARMAGQAYDGGGIASTVAATAAASDDELRALLASRLAAARQQGTTTVEVKSGYGLRTDAELRLLRLAGEVTRETTLLGAHVVPAGADPDAYVALVAGEMLAACAPHARWFDVFCEPGVAFDGPQTDALLAAGAAAGLGLRVHAGQLGAGPGIALAVQHGAASVDHCNHLRPADVDALAASDTVATLLPGADFCARTPYPDARRLLDAGVTVALASDGNPGTCHSTSMPWVISLAVRELHLTPAEAIWAATAGGAQALRRSDIGVVRPGVLAHLAVIDAPTAAHLAYRPGMLIVRTLEL